MRGSQKVAEYLKEIHEYDITDCDESFKYKIDNYGPITKIEMGSKYSYPVNVIFDGNYVICYGDFNAYTLEFGNDMSLKNLPLDSVEYLFGKVQGKHYAYSSDKCIKQLTRNYMDMLNDLGLTEGDQDSFIKFATDYYEPITDGMEDVIIDNDLSESDLYDVQDLFKAAQEDETSYISKVRDINDDNDWINCYDYELYDYGRVIPPYFLNILYYLSIVQNELEEQSNA